MTQPELNENVSERQAAILSRVVKHGFVTIEALAHEFKVSAQTIRREIIELSNQGRIQRFHGGAGPIEDMESARLDYHEKLKIGESEKALIAKRAAELIPDGAVLYLDVGTTIEACAQELANRPGFTIFTNSMRAAMCFDHAEHAVFLLGGRKTGKDGSLTGVEAVQRLTDLHLDVALIACSAIDEDNRVMDFDLAKIAIKRAAMGVADKSFLLATQSKFNSKALAAICPLEAFDEVITDA